MRQVDAKHGNVCERGLLQIPVELRLQIYTHLLPFDINYNDLRGLVMSCRTLKDEVYQEMSGHVQKARHRLQVRWPFDKDFNIPFPGLAFKTKQLLVEVPYYSNGQVHNIQTEMARGEQIGVRDFTQQGAFDLDVKCVVLHIKAPDAVHVPAPVPFYRVPPPHPGVRIQEKEAPLLLKLYLRLCLCGSVHSKFPEHMSPVVYVREYTTCPDTMEARVVGLQRGPEDKLYLTESLREPAYAGTWPVLST